MKLMSETVQPLTHLTYVPVGTRLTREQIGNLSLRELQNRTILDPRYAGFEADFNWRQYVNVDIRDATLRHQVETALEQFSRTEEGQHILRQSLAMQHFRVRGEVLVGAALKSPSLAPDRVTVTDYYRDLDGRIRNVVGSGFQCETGLLDLDKYQITHTEYLGIDRHWHSYSVQDTLIHELAHAADGFLTAENRTFLEATHGVPIEAATTASQRRLAEARGRGAGRAALERITRQDNTQIAQLDERLHHAPIEYPALALGGSFMDRYYHTVPQTLQYPARRDSIGRDPHFFDTIDVPVTPVVPRMANIPSR